MPPLAPEQLERIQAELDSRRRSLLSDVGEKLGNTDNQKYEDIVGRAPTDSGDASVSDELADLNLTMLDRHISALRDIEAAEARIRDGSYGECIDCGGEIGFERLLAQPTAIRCVIDQDQYEKTHVSQATPTL